MILYIGNEGPATTYWVTVSALMVHAQKLNGLGVVLEHRYYGKSQPFNRLTVDNLKYLTSRQAINDLATFQGYLSEKYQVLSMT